MPFFEDLGKKVSQTSQDAIKKTKILAETSKLNSQISGEKKAIADNMSRIGERYFELFRDSPDENLAPFIAAILESQDRILLYEEQINKLKGIETCPNCGVESKEGTLFCPNCGMKLEQPAPAYEPAPAELTPAASGFCTTCGGPLTPGVKFCSACGAKTE